jgi:hypothetical protein
MRSWKLRQLFVQASHEIFFCIVLWSCTAHEFIGTMERDAIQETMHIVTQGNAFTVVECFLVTRIGTFTECNAGVLE